MNSTYGQLYGNNTPLQNTSEEIDKKWPNSATAETKNGQKIATIWQLFVIRLGGYSS